MWKLEVLVSCRKTDSSVGIYLSSFAIDIKQTNVVLNFFINNNLKKYSLIKSLNMIQYYKEMFCLKFKKSNTGSYEILIEK